MRNITEPGRYTDVPAEDYHQQLTPQPSLSSSFAREMISTCPRKAWHNSYLNPDRESSPKRHFDIGTAAHLVFLQPDEFQERTVVVDADDWRTKAAQVARDDAYAAGKTPLLAKDLRMLNDMHAALMMNPLARAAFVEGTAEETFVARDKETGVWLKARVDFRPKHGRWLVDYKTSSSAEPHEVSRAIANHRYYMQDPFYRDVVEAVTGERPRHFWFVVQEKEPPYLVTVHGIDAEDVERGAFLNRRAVWQFAECLETGRWPEYSDKALITSLPPWERERIERGFDREVNPKALAPETLKRLTDWQAPADDRKAS